MYIYIYLCIYIYDISCLYHHIFWGISPVKLRITRSSFAHCKGQKDAFRLGLTGKSRPFDQKNDGDLWRFPGEMSEFSTFPGKNRKNHFETTFFVIL